MPKAPVSFQTPTNELRKGGVVVGRTDRIYQITGEAVIFEDVLVVGDLSGALEYNGKRVRVVRVESMIGLEIGDAGARGPVWKKVECEVLDKRK